jgi:DNA mismatch repair protein MutL
MKQTKSIEILPVEVASQIAAGEVVERPASVVKELLENSLDAGATFIDITIENAGKRLIQVTDNGTGISADELSKAVARHATSKLRTADDLNHIDTLGFRGEALASIGSISRMTIKSHAADEEVGAQIRVDAGVNSPVSPVGVPKGTIIRVEDLFYNVPARLKFQKHDTTERRHIDALATRYALAYPNVRFTLHQEKRISLQTSGSGDRRDVLSALYGVDIARQMIEVIAEDDEIGVSGFISPPGLTRSNRHEITFYVNKRPVADSTLAAALLQAYHTLLMVGRFPLAILFLELNPDTVDVNVHPTKAEVRFRNADVVFRSVQRAVRRALLAHTPVQDLDIQLRWSGSSPAEPPPTRGDRTWDLTAGLDNHAVENEVEETLVSEKQQLPEIQQMPRTRMPLLRLIGQIASTYLVAEGPDGLYLIDQHAAHERVLFEKFMSLRSEHRKLSDQAETIPSQVLLEPVVVEFPPASARLVEEQLPILGELGFHVEPFGPGAYRMRTIPVILSGMEPQAALRVLVEDFEEDETPLQSEIEARVIARVCKRAAVKAGQTLSPDEQKALLRDLEACLAPRTCPHGRPTMIHLSVDLLERQFGRRGPR